MNGEPHIGHMYLFDDKYYLYSYSTTFADAIGRWENVKGRFTFLTTGTDEHGQKVKKEANKRKKEVEVYCDEIASSFANELSHYSLNIGRFIRTTDPDHEQVVDSSSVLCRWYVLFVKRS